MKRKKKKKKKQPDKHTIQSLSTFTASLQQASKPARIILEMK
jgi:hypothetical protein